MCLLPLEQRRLLLLLLAGRLVVHAWRQQLVQELQQRRLQLLLLLPLLVLPHQHRLQLLQLVRQALHAAGQQLHIASLKHRCRLAWCGCYPLFNRRLLQLLRLLRLAVWLL